MKQQELLNTQTSAEETNTPNKESNLIHREPIDNTPFWVIYNTEQKSYMITMGKYRITPEPIESTDHMTAMLQAIRWLETNKWDITLSIALCAITDILSQRDKNKI